MKKLIPVIVLLAIITTGTVAQVSISQEVTAFASFGFADTGQAIATTTEPGLFSDMKNGYYVNANLGFKASVSYVYDIIIKLNSRSRIGSPYLPLQSSLASASNFGLSLDSAYGRINIIDGLQIYNFPLDFFLSAGKFSVGASNYQRVSGYGLESALNMLKTSNSPNISLEVVKMFSTAEQFFESDYSYLNFQIVTNALVNEGLQRLYDNDGSMSNHGKVVIGEYAPQLLVAAKLNNYVLPMGPLSAELVYTMNGGGIYSGHSFGAAVNYNTTVIPEVLFFPVGLGFAYYEKNIDTLSGSTSTGINDSTIDYRDTIRVGFGLGARFIEIFMKEAEVSLAGSFTQVNHIYRDPLNLIGLSIDAKYTHEEKLFVGTGAILGTLTDARWKTKDDVEIMYDDFDKTFKLAENFGYEVYAGINIGSKCNITLGFNNNRGLALNYGLEAIRDGEMKYRQKGSSSEDKLYETFAVYLKTVMKI